MRLLKEIQPIRSTSGSQFPVNSYIVQPNIIEPLTKKQDEAVVEYWSWSGVDPIGIGRRCSIKINYIKMGYIKKIINHTTTKFVGTTSVPWKLQPKLSTLSPSYENKNTTELEKSNNIRDELYWHYIEHLVYKICKAASSNSILYLANYQTSGRIPNI